MSAIVAAPLLVPLATAALTACCRNARMQLAASSLGAALFLAATLFLLARVTGGELPSAVFGNWASPFGIVFRIDATGAALLVITALMGAATLLYLAGGIDAGRSDARTLPLIHGTLAGVAGAFSTADLFNLYVWFELMLIGALGLFALSGGKAALEAAFKYLVLSLFGTLLLLLAIGAVYAATGHLQFAALSEAVGRLPAAHANVLLALLGLAFLIKSGAVPLHAWLPASYPALPTPVLALFAGLLTKVGVYAVLRTGSELFPMHMGPALEVLGWVAVITMVVGVLGAAYHWDMRRILAFHIVSQIGYILLALALGGREGHAAALFYTLHHILVKANLFLIAGMIFALCGSFDLRRCGGLYQARPVLALLFAVPALSLVGIPPLSGFWAKFLVLELALAQGRWLWSAAALLVSLLTLYSMQKVWVEAFWKPHPQQGWAQGRTRLPVAAWIATWTLAALTLLISLHPQPLVLYASQAAAAAVSGSPAGKVSP